jgi:hypothetical protein
VQAGLIMEIVGFAALPRDVRKAYGFPVEHQFLEAAPQMFGRSP